MLATLLVELGETKGKCNHVMMPYANSLYSSSPTGTRRELWAESLGKQKDLKGNTVHAGFTPIKALGTTDQHSQVQLYREGPNDKVIGMVEVAKFDHDVNIPKGLGVEALQSYLEGRKMLRAPGRGKARDRVRLRPKANAPTTPSSSRRSTPTTSASSY